MVLRDFKEPLNKDTDLVESVVSNIEILEFIPDDKELTTLFIQVQGSIRNKLCPIYITHV